MIDHNVNNFIVWIVEKGYWKYDNQDGLWKQDGFKNRTTNELYEYYLSTHLEEQLKR